MSIFLARSNVPHALLAQVVPGQVDPARVASVAEHRRQVARKAEWVIGVGEEDQTAIGRQPSPRKVDEGRVVLDRRQVERACARGWH